MNEIISMQFLHPPLNCYHTGSYDEFDLANETDTLEPFLKLAPPVEENNGKEVSNNN